MAPAPRVLFAVPDADADYSTGKIWRLAARLRDLAGWTVTGITNEKKWATSAEEAGIPVRLKTFQAPHQALYGPEVHGAVDEALRAMGDLVIPGAGVHLWKLTVPDDFRGQMPLLGALHEEPLQADLLVLPLGSVYSSSLQGSALQTWLLAAARRQGIPVLGLETFPLGNKLALATWPCDHYAVRSPASRDFLVRHGLARPEEISVLRYEESYLVRAGLDDYAEAFLKSEQAIRSTLSAPPERKVIALFHSVAFTWEMRRTLAALSRLAEPVTIVIHVDARVFRRGLPERDLVMRAYAREFKNLDRVTMTEAVGRGLLLMLSDVALAATSGEVTEQAALRGKPALVCQSMCEERWEGPRLRWEPDPDAVPGVIERWSREGLLDGRRLDQVCTALLAARKEAVHA